MPERVQPGPVQNNSTHEAVCIHTKKIYDSCKDKDCIEDLRLYPTCHSQCIIERALSIRAGKAELLHVYIDVNPVGFNRGFYTVDVRYFYRVTADAFVGAARPLEISGLCVFDKRVILFGSEGSAKIFTSEQGPRNNPETIESQNLPIAVVEAVDPIVLGVKLVDICDAHSCDSTLSEIPPAIAGCFGCDLSFGDDRRRVYVTLGQFSIIRLERETQLLMPAFSYCIPEKECVGGSDDDPCEIFRNVKFPVDEFFPPNALSGPECYRDAKNLCN